MSRPISETPILEGKDAKVFTDQIKWNKERPKSKDK